MIITCIDKEDALHQLAQNIQNISQKAIDHDGSFLIAISGGSIVGQVKDHFLKLDTTRWIWGVADERHVPLSDSESNYKLVNDTLSLGKPIPLSYHEDVACMAKEYDSNVKNALKQENKTHFDAIVLGAGPDGHIASLFPGMPWTHDESLIMPVFKSPKPPPQRITLTMQAIKDCPNVFVVILDPKKSSVIKMIENGDNSIPINKSEMTIITDLLTRDS